MVGDRFVYGRARGKQRGKRLPHPARILEQRPRNVRTDAGKQRFKGSAQKKDLSVAPERRGVYRVEDEPAARGDDEAVFMLQLADEAALSLCPAE